MAINNGSFETADATLGPGLADGWIVSTNVTDELYAEFATPGPSIGSTDGQEEFDTGWTPPVDQEFVASFSGGFFVDLYPAFFDDEPQAFEDFENEWSIVAGLAHVGTATLAAISQALFDAATPAGSQEVEDFENGWNAPSDAIILAFGAGDTAAASFDTGTPETFEDFEEQWLGNENFLFTFAGPDISLVFFNEPGPSLVAVERFGESGTRFEVGPVIVDVGADTFNDSGPNFLAGERVQFRVQGGSPPSPVQLGPTLYFARNIGVTFQISEQAASAIIDLTTAGTGVLFVKGDPTYFWVDELTGV